MSVLQYVGARYVPKLFDDGNGGMEWQPDTFYEPLTIVTYNNSSYISRGPVPASIGYPASNGEYWALSGSYNAWVGSIDAKVDRKLDFYKKFPTCELKPGTIFSTAGFYSSGDGGADIYLVTSDKIQPYSISIGENFATPISIPINVKALGAISDGTPNVKNDQIFRSLSNENRVLVPEGSYNIAESITISCGNAGSVWDMQCATIMYSGTSYALIIDDCDYLTINLGKLRSPNGDGILFSGLDTHCAYITVNEGSISGRKAVSILSNNNGYANQIVLNGCHLKGREYGCIAVNNNTRYNMDNLIFNRVSIEGTSGIGFSFQGIGAPISECAIYNPRLSEFMLGSGIVLDTKGTVTNVTGNLNPSGGADKLLSKITPSSGASGIAFYDGNGVIFILAGKKYYNRVYFPNQMHQADLDPGGQFGMNSANITASLFIARGNSCYMCAILLRIGSALEILEIKSSGLSLTYQSNNVIDLTNRGSARQHVDITILPLIPNGYTP